MGYPIDNKLNVVYQDVNGDQNPEIFFSQDVPSIENPENRPQVIYFDRREQAARVATPGDPAWPDQPRLSACQAGDQIEITCPAWEKSIILARREGAGLPYSPFPAIRAGKQRRILAGRNASFPLRLGLCGSGWRWET